MLSPQFNLPVAVLDSGCLSVGTPLTHAVLFGYTRATPKPSRRGQSLPHVVAGCESPKARGQEPQIRTGMRLFCLRPSFGGSNGRAQALPATLRVPRSLTPVRAAAQCESWSAVVHLARLEINLANTASLGAGAPAIGADALTIEIHPDTGWATYRGSRAQLEAEGVMPADFAWPTGWASVGWVAGHNTLRLRRVRPPQAKGSRKDLTGCDYWLLQIDVRSKPEGYYEQRNIWRQVEVLKATIYRCSPAGIAAKNALIHSSQAAKRDVAFQATMAKCTPTARRTTKGSAA
jgi:hypothetical protein